MSRIGLPPAADTEALTYQGSAIRRRGAMLNLTDMWRAAGGPPHRRPADWLALEETARFRAYAAGHWTEPGDDAAPLNADHAGIHGPGGPEPEGDGLVAAARGGGGGTWAHWQLALAYARYLSPRFHLWCNTVVRAAMERRHPPAQAWPAPPSRDPLLHYLERRFRGMHERLDTLDRHAADLMLLLLSLQDLLLGRRREFTELSRATIRAVVAAEPYDWLCPCCGSGTVLDAAGRAVAGAEYDHFFHRGLNRPEHGWLVCRACHLELTGGGYLARFARVQEFRAFQAAVLEYRRRMRRRAGPGPGAPAA